MAHSHNLSNVRCPVCRPTLDRRRVGRRVNFEKICWISMSPIILAWLLIQAGVRI